MPTAMNPDYPKARGCFIDNVSKPGKFIIVDYPTWHVNNGDYVSDANPAIPDGKDWQKEFDTRDAAVTFADDEHYVICQLPCSLDPKRNANKTEEVDEEEVECSLSESLEKSLKKVLRIAFLRSNYISR